MMLEWICNDIENFEEEWACINKNNGVLYNQCCQNCDRKHSCNRPCEYAYDEHCIAKELKEIK